MLTSLTSLHLSMDSVRHAFVLDNHTPDRRVAATNLLDFLTYLITPLIIPNMDLSTFMTLNSISRVFNLIKQAVS